MASEPPVADAATVARELWDELVAFGEDLGEADWERSTPWCPDWTVADLLSHCSGVQVWFDGSAEMPEPPPGWEPPDTSPLDAKVAELVAARRHWDPAERLRELRAAADGHVARVAAVTDWGAPTRGPLGETTEAGLFSVRCFDLWVHLQDLREALGQPVPTFTDAPAAAVAYRYVAGLAGWLFARRARAPEGATMALRLGAPLDVDTVVQVRDGRGLFAPEADPGACAVTGSPAAFTLLVTGRGAPDRWREAGLLDWSGPRGEEFAATARVFS